MKPAKKCNSTNYIVLKELTTADGSAILIRCSYARNSMFKNFTSILKLMWVKSDVHIERTDLSIAHLTGAKGCGPRSQETEIIWDQAASTARDQLMDILQLRSTKKKKRCALRFTMVVVNPDGLVEYDKPILNWTETNMHEYLKHAKRLRKLSTQTDFIERFFSLN